MSSRILLLLVALVAATSAGCGNGLASVEGAVSIDEERVIGGGDVKATVFFHSTSGGPAAFGLVDGEGRYSLMTGSKPGVTPGEYAVSFTATKKIVPADGGTPIGRRISPPKYATPNGSGLSFTVTPGSNTIDLDLTSGPDK